MNGKTYVAHAMEYGNLNAKCYLIIMHDNPGIVWRFAYLEYRQGLGKFGVEISSVDDAGNVCPLKYWPSKAAESLPYFGATNETAPMDTWETAWFE